MNGIFDNQTSGNDWPGATPAMLHEREQDRIDAPTARQHGIFDDLERQMERHEQEHRVMVTEITRAFLMPRDNSVEEFLSSHRTLPQFLIQALPHLREFFGDVLFSLRATGDEYGWQQLYVDIHWAGTSDEAFQAIDRFQDGWWIAHSNMTAGHLTFTYRLV
jgi:hypothetical protein